MYLTTRGVVLRVSDYNDRDALVTVLTEDNGKLTLKARGLRRKNAPLSAACQLLAYGEFTIFAYNGKYTINEAHTLELFRGLRGELTKLCLGTYFAQVCELISQEDMPSPDLLSLLLNSLYVLSATDKPEPLVKAAFELRAACIAGFTPALFGCHVCGSQTPDRFDLSAGQLECSTCRGEGDGIRVPVTQGVLEAMRYLCLCDIRKLFSFRVGDETLRKLGSLTEAYLTTQTEKSYFSLDYYKSLFYTGGIGSDGGT